MKRILLGLAAAAAVLALNTFAANAGDTVQDWDQAKAPPPPALKDVTVKAATTSFLILDIEAATCNEKDRPRCVAEVPGMAAFLKKARDAKMLVTYSNTGRGSPETIMPPLKPMEGEHVVKSTVNKFQNTDLEQYLKDKKIETVIICGTTAFGASLHTATGATVRGLKVIIPVDCNPGSSVYEEQAALFSMVNGPGTAANLTATRLSMIKID
jgi:hypothetical protein